MLIAAGYMNYTTNVENTLEAAKYIDTEKYSDLGDATLVSSGNVEVMQNEESLNTVTEETNNVQESNTNNETTDNSAKETSAQSKNQYFTQSKIDRDNMYSQLIESYQKMLSSSETSETQKGIAQEEIQKINNEKNAIMIAENLIKNKGFDNVIIFVNDTSVNVIIDANELTKEQVAQIQNIVQRELKANTEDIHISRKDN